jgi:hypothetical protein
MRKYAVVVTLALGLVLLFAFTAAPASACDCSCAPDCRSPGYWMNHPCEWPSDTITIGGVTYQRAVAIGWMGTPVSGDKSITLFRALVAAKLNVLAGCPSCCVAGTITRADAWMSSHPVGSGVKASSCAWKYAECLYWRLDAWNNGYLSCGG